MATRKMVVRTGPVEGMVEGQTVEGYLRDIQPTDKDNIIVVEGEDGQQKRLWGSAVIDKTLTDADLGKYVSIKYLGKEDIGGGKTLRIYEISVEAAGDRK